MLRWNMGFRIGLGSISSAFEVCFDPSLYLRLLVLLGVVVHWGFMGYY